MKCKIGDISNIHFGPYLKGEDKGDAKYLMASHFDKSYKPTKFQLSYTNINEKVSEELLRPNDVILAGKGQRLFAWAYDQYMGPCVPSSLFFVIHTDSEQVNSKYLAYYLNSEKVQHELKLLGGGSTIPSIPKNELKKLAVHIPTIQEQMRFVEVCELLEEDVALTQDLLSKKMAMKKTIINKMITNQKTDNRT